MACPSRINQILSRSITTGDFYSGLKHIKISTPTSDQPILPSASVAHNSTQFISGCKTTSRQAVKTVVITASQHAIRRSTSYSNTTRTITPTLGRNLFTRTDQSRHIHTGVVQLDQDKPTKPHGGDNKDSNVVGTKPENKLPDGRLDTSGSSQGGPSKSGGSPLVPSAAGGIPGPTGGANSGDRSAAKGPPGDKPPSQGNSGGGGSQQGPTPPGDASGSNQPPGDATGGSPPSQPPSGGSEPPQGSIALIKPPVYIPGLRGAYANALYSAAYKRNALDAVEQDLIKIRDIFQRDDMIKQFLLSPEVSKKLKLEAMQSFKKLNLNELSFNLLLVITENQRSSKLLSVISAFMELMTAHRGIVDCSVISARPLKPEQKERLTQTLAKLLPGKTPHTKESVDPTLLGGFILLIGGKHIDMSMKTKFNIYESTIKLPV